MKQKQLKELLKHIVSEISNQSEMIANKDVEPDVYGTVNVAEGFFTAKDAERVAKNIWGAIKKVAKVSHPDSNAELFSVHLNDGSLKILRKNKEGKWFYLDDLKKKYISIPDVNEQSCSGAAGGYMTPFAFAPSRKKKKKKTNEKTLPDGKYSDDMEDGIRTKTIAGMSENDDQYLPQFKKRLGGWSDIASVKIKQLQKLYDQAVRNKKDHIKIGDGNYATPYIKRIIDWMTDKDHSLNEMSTSGAVGQSGGMIQTPAWGTKNKLGSPGGIKGSEKLGYKVVKSITNEGK